MNFEEIYSNDPPGEEHNIDGDTIKKEDHNGPCCRCKKSTSYYSISFEEFVCSTECLDSKWSDYWRN